MRAGTPVLRRFAFAAAAVSGSTLLPCAATAAELAPDPGPRPGPGAQPPELAPLPPLPRDARSGTATQRIWFGATTTLGLTSSTPLLATQAVRLGYRYALPGTSRVMKDTYVGFGVAADFTKQFARVGPMVELKPLSFLSLTLGYDYSYYFTPKLFASFKDVGADYDEDGVDAEELDVNAIRPNAHKVHGALWLGHKFGPVAIANRLRGTYQTYEIENGDNVFFDIETFQLAPASGWVLEDDFTLAYAFSFGLRAGALYHVDAPFYDGQADPANVDNPNPPANMRVGPTLGYVLADRWPKALRNATVQLAAGWWVMHKVLAGNAVPWMNLTVAFESDLWSR